MQPTFLERDPLLLKIGSEHKLYFNIEILNDWVQQNISLKELLEHLKMDNLARNHQAIDIQNVTIEDDSLWLVKNNLCILANPDKYVAVKIDNRFRLISD